MAFITVTGKILDPSGTVPTSGSIEATLSGYLIDSDENLIVAKKETAAVSAVDGTFSIVLESTLDGTPNTRTYAIRFTGVIEGADVTQDFGSFALAPSPSSVTLADLIQSGVVGATAVYPLIAATPDAILTLHETDQSAPAGWWRWRISGDVYTLEKNTAAAADFSTLTELLRATATDITMKQGLLTLGVTGTAVGALKLAGNTSGLVTLSVGAAAGTWTMKLPTSGGTSGYLLSTDGAGVCTWVAPPSALSGMTAGRVQFALNATTLADDADLTFSGDTLTIGSAASATGKLAIKGTTSGTVTLSAADAAGTYTLKLPTGIGTADFALITDGTNQTSFVSGQSIAGLKTTSTPQFTRLGLGATADATALLNLNTALVYGDGSGNIGFNVAAAGGQIRFGGTSTANNGIYQDVVLTLGAGVQGNLHYIVGGLTEAGSGTHSLLTAVRIDPPTITGGAATVTDTATLYIHGAMTATVTGANRALWVNAGTVRMGGYGAGTATFDANGVISSVSDERLKNVQRLFGYGLRELRTLAPILFKWRKESGLDTRGTYPGFSAQQIKKVIPETIGIQPDGSLTLQDRGLIALVVNACKELDRRLMSLETRT